MSEPPEQAVAQLQRANIHQWDDRLMFHRGTYLYPFTNVTYGELGRESLVNHAATKAGIASGSKEAAVYRAMTSFLSQLCCFCSHTAILHQKSPDPDVQQQRMGNILSIGLAVSTVSTAIAELLASLGVSHLTAKFVDWLTESCVSGVEHCHIFGLSCATFGKLCVSGTIGVMSAFISIILKSSLQFFRKEDITIGDNIVAGLFLGMTASVVTYFMSGVVSILVTGIVTEAISGLQVRARKAGHSLAYHVYLTISYAVAEAPANLIRLLRPPPRNKIYDYNGEFSDLMACDICYNLMYDAVRVNGHCYCRSCITKYVETSGKDLYNTPVTVDDILPALEVNNCIEEFANAYNIAVIDDPEANNV